MNTTIKNTLTKDVKIFQRSVPILLIALIALTGTGAAALLSVYGTVDGSANVHQSVLVNGNDINSGNYQASYSYDVNGGELGQESFSIQNNADEPASVNIFTQITDGESGDGSTSVGDGLTTTHLVYDQWNLSAGDSTPNTASISVEATEDHNTAGDYAIHFASSEATSDYARVFFPASISGSDDLVYEGVANGDNPLDDEAWLIMEDGTQLYAHGATSSSTSNGVTEVTYDIDATTWYNMTGQSVTPDFSKVVAIGIGQGAPSDTSAAYTVDTYVDNVRIGSGGAVDEQASVTLDLLPTGTSSHPQGGQLTTQYRTGVVTDFAINVWPGTYTLETTVAPAN